jgi:hypothetical protein
VREDVDQARDSEVAVMVKLTACKYAHRRAVRIVESEAGFTTNFERTSNLRLDRPVITSRSGISRLLRAVIDRVPLSDTRI